MLEDLTVDAWSRSKHVVSLDFGAYVSGKARTDGELIPQLVDLKDISIGVTYGEVSKAGLAVTVVVLIVEVSAEVTGLNSGIQKILTSEAGVQIELGCVVEGESVLATVEVLTCAFASLVEDFFVDRDEVW